MPLPESHELPVKLLAACFNKTSSTYKYYWFLSIIQALEYGKTEITKRELFARMISNAWFTVNYFHISFGKQDLIQDAILLIKGIEKISIEENQTNIFQILNTTQNPITISQLRHFNNNVPHWFMSPWFPSKSKREIYNASKNFSEDCLYALYDDIIKINPKWESYLISNIRLLKDFCYWNLALFLQGKNPNVPDIPNKLIKLALGNNLTKQRTKFWDLVIKELGSIECIYTGNKLTLGDYAVEHFIPYNFVSHDLIWNLIPADRSFNSSKSDKLPPLEKYFKPFFKIQKQAVEIVREKTPNNKLLEDYFTIFPNLNNFSEEKFKDTIQPLITIASNNGFEFLI